MTPEIADHTVTLCLRSLSELLSQAASLARAAASCAEEGNRNGAIGIVLDVEELTRDANALLNTATFVHRQARP